MQDEDLRAFLVVAQTQSMTRAGQRLGVAKSVVSRRLTNLEHHLGVRLFSRSTRTMSLTQDGLLLLERAQAVMESIEALKDLFSGSTRRLSGPLRITAPTSLGHLHLAPLLFSFAREHPDITLKVELSDRSVDLVGEGYDLAVRVGQPSGSDVVARRLCMSERVLVASPALIRRMGLPATVDELEARWPAVAYSNRPSHREWLVDTPDGRRSLRLNTRFLADSGALALSAVVHGLGVTITPTFLAADAIAAGDLRRVQLHGIAPVPDEIYVLRPANRALPLRVRALIDHLVEGFAGVTPWDAAIGSAEGAGSQAIETRNSLSLE